MRSASSAWSRRPGSSGYIFKWLAHKWRDEVWRTPISRTAVVIAVGALAGPAAWAAGVSLLMRHINGVYSQRFNRRHGLVGHLLQGRFKAILVTPS